MGKSKGEKAAAPAESGKPVKSSKTTKPTKDTKPSVDVGVARKEIDDLFNTAKKAKVEAKVEEEEALAAKPVKVKKVKKEESLPYGIMKSDNGNVIVNPEAPLERIDPESGLPVYKAHLLKPSKVRISFGETASDFSDPQSELVINVSFSNNGSSHSWETKRTIEDLIHMKDSLGSAESLAHKHPFLTEELPQTCQALQDSLNDYFSSLGEDLWCYQNVVSFLDNCNQQSLMSRLHTEALAQQARDLTAQLADLNGKVETLISSHHFLCGIVQSMVQSNDQGLVKKGGAKRSDLLKLMYSNFPSGAVATSVFFSSEDSDVAEEPSTGSHGSSSLTLSTTDLNAVPLSVVGPYTDATVATNSLYHNGHSNSSDTDATGQSSPTRSIATDKGALSPNPNADSYTSVKKFFAPSLPSIPSLSIAESADGASPRSSTTTASWSASAPVTPHFAMDLHPSDAMCAYYSASVDRIVEAVKPTNSRMMYRHSVQTMLAKQVRLSLNSNAFATGLHEILCSLPDDPISLSVIVGKAQLPNWHVCLTDRLNLIVERLATTGSVEILYPEEEELLANLPDDFRHPLRHELSNISHTKLNMTYCVQLQVDQSTEVEILANNRHDLCLLSFLEEISELVDQDGLFKRSLLLIRAWWFYETAAYVGTAIRHYLKDPCICVMVVAIFNQYHARISSPLQALCLFLAEFSAYDGATQAITLQGIVPFKSPTSSQPMLLDAHPSHLISCEIIERYWNLFNLCTSSTDVPEYEHFMRSSSSDDVHNDEFRGMHTVSVASGGTGVLRPEYDPQRSAPGGIEKVNMKSLSNHNLHYFERHVFNIVHPFNHTNMVAEKLSSRRQMRLHKAFQIGATEITVYLRQSIDNANNAGDLLHYFPNLLARFGDSSSARSSNGGSMLGTSSGSISALEDDLSTTGPVEPQYFSNSEKLSTKIMYCNMMLESVLSESALLSLSTEILAVKGPLPVGEIGKLLAETTSIGNMSQKLKEKFGGLKKFLERFPGVFVISNDHPFNPNVLLRTSLSSEHQDLIDRGIFPHQLLQKTKKASAPSAKKKKNTSIPGSTMSPDFSAHSGSPLLSASQSTGPTNHKMLTPAGLSNSASSTVSTGGTSHGVPSPATANSSLQSTPKFVGKGLSPSGGQRKSFTGFSAFSQSSPHSSHNQFVYPLQQQGPAPQQQQQNGNVGSGGQGSGGYHSTYQQQMLPRSPPVQPHHPYNQQGQGGGQSQAFGHQQIHTQSHQPAPSSGFLSSGSSGSSSGSGIGGAQFSRQMREPEHPDSPHSFVIDPNGAFRSSQVGAGARIGSGGQPSLNYFDDFLGTGPLSMAPPNQMLSNLRIGAQDFSPQGQSEELARQRLHSTGSLYDGQVQNTKNNPRGAYTAFQQQFRTPYVPQHHQQPQGSAPQLSPNQALYAQQQQQPQAHQSQQQQQSGGNHPPHDSVLRDFSQY